MSQSRTLVVMAAGMGSRYGGLKQLEPVGSHGQLLLDYTLYDAVRAGFSRAVFVLKREMYETFSKSVLERVGTAIETRCVFQELADIPNGFKIPDGRVKPWGTAHAVLTAKSEVGGPFAVVNADDFYGSGALSAIGSFLSAGHKAGEYAMVSYLLKNTVPDSGSVARGVCEINDGFLSSVTERTRIERRGSGIAFALDNDTWQTLDGDTPVSMNMWGFGADFMSVLEDGFAPFLKSAVETNPLKAEYFLPSVVQRMLDSGRASVRVLQTPDKWYGMTYREDRQTVCDAIDGLTKAGVYPKKLWD